MKRLDQIVLVVSLLGLSWLGMQAVHELGHVLAAITTGGTIEQVVLHPLTISRTDLGINPHPLLVCWAGPLLGVVLPLVVLAMAWALRFPATYLLRFFAGFCLIANGAYIGGGAWAAAGDAGDMLRYGSPGWLMVGFGLVGVALGLWLWNGLGPSFGLGDAQGKVSRPAAISTAVLLLVAAGLELALSGR